MFIFSLCVVSSVALFLWVQWGSRKRKLPLPPGPPATPVLGHLLTIPSTKQEYYFYKLGKTYGNIIHLHIPGRSYIVLNSVHAAIDLLDKRSHNYSDRPALPVFEEMGWVWSLPFMPDGPQFQLHRRMFQQYFNRKECISYQPIQTREAHVLLQNLSSTPDQRDEHISQYATAIVLRIAFGYQLTSTKDVYLDIMRDVSHAMTTIGSPGGTPIDFFPFLRYLPSWFPGAYYAGAARRARPAVQRLHDFPLSQVQEQMANGKAKPSFMASHLDSLSNPDGTEIPITVHDVQGAVGAIYAGGTETTWSSVSIFFLAMILNPECQTRAQEEIDAVIGSNRLPDFEDRESLPYVECLMQETLRWNHAVPLGAPHRSLEDDTYNGMFIPKGSIIIANTRGMSLDENVYNDPLSFNPSRYLPKPIGNGEPYPVAHFGFGRRICPGRHLASPSLWIAIVSILATMHISKALDEDGKQITPETTFTPGGTSHPVPFKCSIRPRNETAQSLIERADTLDNY